MERYLLDTNIASYAMKGTSDAVDRSLKRVAAVQLAISAVTEAELRFGAARLTGASRLNALLEAFLQRIVILPWDSAAAQQYGRLRADLERHGRPIGNMDMMIAAHALALGATLVTSDRAFSRIKKLTIEDWTKGSIH